MHNSKFISKAVKNNASYWEVLSSEDINSIHHASMRLLSATGVRVDHPECVEILRKGGADVKDGNVVCISEEMVQAALQTVPKSIPVYDRNGNHCLTFEDGYSYFGGGSDTVFTIDHQTQKPKEVSLESVKEFSRFMDGLDQYDFVMSMGSAKELPAGKQDCANFLAMVENTIKPIAFTAQTPDAMQKIADICAELRGGIKEFGEKPFAFLYAMPTAPLIHTQEALADIMIAAKYKIPCLYGSAPMKGATGPITAAGMLVLSNAETLSGLVLHQLVNPGAPYIYAATLGPLEMKTMVNIYNGPDSMQMQTGSIQLGRYYGLPTFATAGCSDSKLFDGQATAECTSSLMNAVISGGVVVHDVGYLESGLCSSMDMAVFANEMISHMRFMIKGVKCDKDHLLEDEIAQIGIGGHYMMNDTTLDMHEDEIWYSQIMSHENYEQWSDRGKTTLFDRVHQKALEILSSHTPEPLDADLVNRLHQIAEGNK